MPKVRIIEYEGSDDQILKLLTHGIAPGIPAAAPVTQNNVRSNGTGVWDEVARKFHKHISDTANWGRTGQQKAITAWLAHKDGEIELAALWKAAGVKSQHDYAGVGGSLTKNMVKSGGPKEWYQYYKNSRDEWIYKITDELLEPLRNAFGIK